MQAETRTQLDELVTKNRVVLFMKGSRHFPQCGFSATVTGILNGYLPKYETVNVLSSADIRDGIKEYSSWPTIPQLYIDGKFVGGCDIVKELHATGELAKLLGAEANATKKADAGPPPSITLTEAARASIVAAQKDAGGDPLRVSISPSHEFDLYFEAKAPNDVALEVSGVTFVLDPESAARAGELTIELVDGKGFRVQSSKAAPQVKVMSPPDLKNLLATDSKHVLLLDVRPEAERKLASIPGHKPLDPNAIDELMSLPADMRVVVYCHHGHRSRAAAEQLVARGVKNVFNLDRGIDGYASVDSSIARY